MSPLIITLILLALALLGAGIAIVFLNLRLHRLQKNLAAYKQNLAQTVSGDNYEPLSTGDFNESMLEATLKKRFEDGTGWRRIPEKYRYAAALASQGADAERIAELLQLPLPEVIQLVALNKAAGGGPTS